MIGIWQAYASIYLIILGVAMLAGFGIPLVLAPIAWARAFRWPVPSDGPLVPFLGRSLGVFICVIAAYAIRISGVREAHASFLELILWLLVGMLGLHIYGAIKRAQPITETIEIGMWVILLLATLAFLPGQ